MVSECVPQPFVTVYDITALPALNPRTPPPVTVATARLPELHTPPDAVSLKVVVLPMHNGLPPPVITPDVIELFTVIVTVSECEPQLLLRVYDIKAVPAPPPKTTPPELTVIAALPLLLHVPAPPASCNVVDDPWHIEVVPVIGKLVNGDWIVTVAVSVWLPQPFVAV